MTRRASRTLMGLLSLTTIVGVSAYAIAHRKSTAAAPPVPNKPAGTAVSLIALAPGTTEAAAPATQPAGDLRNLKPDITTVTPDGSGSNPKSQISNLKSQISNPNPQLSDPNSPARLASAAVSPAGALADGKARLEAGDLLAGRKLLNDALISGQLSPADAASAKHLLSDANKTLIFSPRRLNDDPWAGGHPVTPGENLQKIAFKYGLTPELLLRINGLSDARKLRANSTIKILQGPFHAVVSKKAFTLDLYLGSPGEHNALYVTTYSVGLGKDDSTPAGTWIVEQRVPNPKWWGARGLAPIEAGDPKNPLGKFWIALAGIDGKAEGQQSYGIHGTIDPDSIGKQASMGCIRMRNEDVAIVYELLVAGKSTVVVKD